MKMIGINMKVLIPEDRFNEFLESLEQDSHVEGRAFLEVKGNISKDIPIRMEKMEDGE